MRWLISILFLGAFLPLCEARQLELPPMQPLYFSYRKADHLVSDFNSVERPTYRKFQKLLTERNYKDLNEFLTRLKSDSDFAPLFRSKVLMYSSESLFQTSVSSEFPRIVSHFAGFFMGMTGDPSHPNSYNSIEVAEYDFDSHRMLPRFASHNGNLTNTELPSFDVQNAPTQCADCHGADFQLVWGSYALWPGAVGSLDDRVIPTEDKLFSDLIKNLPSPNYERYRLFFDEKDTTERFLRDNPNLTLATHASALKYRQLVERLEAAGLLRPYLYALVGAVNNCDMSDFIPGELYTRHADRAGSDITKIEERMTTQINNDVRASVERYLGLTQYPGTGRYTFDLDKVSQMAKLWFLIDGQPFSRKVSFDRVGLSAKPGYTVTYQHSNGAQGLNDLLQRELAPLLADEGIYNPKQSCNFYSQKSRDRLESFVSNRPR